MGIHKQAVLRLGWMLFLTLRGKLLPTFPDLVRCGTCRRCADNAFRSVEDIGCKVAAFKGGLSRVATTPTLCKYVATGALVILVCAISIPFSPFSHILFVLGHTVLSAAA
eukprot:365061-Chlamydomonas_euryale.AAC.10